MQLSAHVLDNLIAPNLSALGACGAPDVPELPNYRGSLILNHILSGARYSEQTRVLLSGFVIRLGEAISEYRLGRHRLLEYVAALPEQNIGAHRRAVTHFETCVLRLHLCIRLLEAIGKAFPGDNPPVYVQKDNSEYDRLRKLSNRIKRFDDDVDDAVRKNQPLPLAPRLSLSSPHKGRTRRFSSKIGPARRSSDGRGQKRLYMQVIAWALCPSMRMLFIPGFRELTLGGCRPCCGCLMQHTPGTPPPPLALLKDPQIGEHLLDLGIIFHRGPGSPPALQFGEDTGSTLISLR